MRRLATGLIAGLFMVAAVAKIIAPIQLSRSIAFLLPWLAEHDNILLTLTGAVAGVEAALAILIISGAWKANVLWIAAGVLTLFTIALGLMIAKGGSPPCGCFGAPRGLAPDTEHLAGMLRNLGLIAFIAWLLRETPRDERSRSPVRLHAGAQGFTIIELLVVIVIISVLISLALPALLGARERARLTGESQLASHLASALAMYQNDHREAYPFYGAPGDPLAPLEFDGVQITGIIAAPKRFFTFHRWLWASAIYPNYLDAPRDEIEADGRAEFMQGLGWPSTVIAADFQMASVCFARPAFWSEEDKLGHSALDNVHLLQRTQLSDLRFPAQKGIIGRELAGSAGFPDTPSMTVGLGDGSVRTILWEQFLGTEGKSVNRPWGATGLVIDSTVNGLNGIDF